MAKRAPMHLLRLRGFPILQQLQLEERLLRTTPHNWCLINEGTSPPVIVMGISGKPEQLLDVKAVIRDDVPVIRRFSGGGTVIVDESTVFVTLICRGDAVPVPKLYPRPIMDWTEELYVPAFRSVPGFQLREHDYVFNDKKFGGNAQSITKGRFLHHTSFLWDYQDARMAYLSHPDRAPAYRLARKHSDFICRLKDHLPSREVFVDSVLHAFEQQFSLEETDLERIEQTQPLVPHLNSTHVLSTKQLEDSLLKLLPQKQ
ncbi:hypothetical protein KC19_11G064300 [Ceratodon purpureus]|uniref:BPL/LPL catalytic domain-containing protein n=1 Tax=Ceratodon purpureus TaxID=3225 RepID=A0A8T0GDI2_CERPU|nr:hypothetical protein KC19_11G064300 [Ceratodon purpureus]